ncbi:hypothetical protein V0288_03565 [Pannus brasiliensis CCIBt3594]|uniref:Uncharacterized protein n=1 Tax=Pannus brasiliensis CCIBt3594 TaxID=1427578 RepID=A0AAW9QRF5_9CHRO
MKKLPLVLSAGSIALLLGGCPSSPTNQSQPLTQESPAAAPSPQASPPAFAGATQPATRPPSVNAITGLVPPTDPDQKRKQLDKDKGRVDPTSLFSITPEVEIVVEKKPGVPAPRPRATVSRPPVAVLPNSVAPALAPRPVIPRTPAAPLSPPPPPTPSEAMGILVSGIFQLPTKPAAIIKVPGERTERRVIPGDRLANGAILVKSIDTNPANPSVTLEQYGQTVIRRLGEGIQAAADGTPVSGSAMVYTIPAKGEL